MKIPALNSYASVLRISLCAAVIALPATTVAADSSQSFEGRIAQMTVNAAVMDNGKSYRLDTNTKCFDTEGYRLTCATLVGVGYIDRARITLNGDTVGRIDIVKLPQ